MGTFLPHVSPVISAMATPMTKHKVFLPVHPQRIEIPTHLESFQHFQKKFDVVIKTMTAELDDWIALFQGELSDISALWVTNACFMLPGKFNSLIDHFPSSLKVVALPWVGHDLFDGKKLRERGIALVNVGDSSAKDVADMALWLTLGTFRYVSYFDRAMRENKGNITTTRKVIGGTEFDPVTKQPLPTSDPARQNWAEHMKLGGKPVESPAGKVAGIVGLGAIGKEIAKRLWAIGMTKILYTKRTPLSEEESKTFPFELVYCSSFVEMVPQIDLLVLAVPHTPETTDMVNADTIKLFKKGSRIVNIGRGSAIDEEVMLQALDDGTLNSVGLDVFKNEPNVDPRFCERFDVVVAPHLGSFTMDNTRGAAERTIENIENVLLEDGPGICCVN